MRWDKPAAAKSSWTPLALASARSPSVKPASRDLALERPGSMRARQRSRAPSNNPNAPPTRERPVIRTALTLPATPLALLETPQSSFPFAVNLPMTRILSPYVRRSSQVSHTSAAEPSGKIALARHIQPDWVSLGSEVTSNTQDEMAVDDSAEAAISVRARLCEAKTQAAKRQPAATQPRSHNQGESSASVRR